MKLLSVNIENLFSYKSLYLELSDLHLALFLGRNGSGKTSIFDIICWILYGQTPRKKYNKLIRDVPKKQKQGIGTLIFVSGGNTYTITRKIGAEIGLWIWCNGELLDLRTPTMRQMEIVKVIGMSFKTFLNVAYFSQGDIGKFLNATSTDRIEIISNILNFDTVDGILGLIDGEIKELEGDINELRGKISTYQEYIDSVNIKALTDKKKKLIKKLDKITTDIESVQLFLGKAYAKVKMQTEIDELKSNFEREKNTAKRLIEQHKKTLSRSRVKLDKCIDPKSYDSEYAKIEEHLEFAGVAEARMIEINDEYEKLVEKKASKESEHKLNKGTISELVEVTKMVYKSCPTCKMVIDEDGIDNIETLISDLEGKNLRLSESIVKISGDMDGLNKQKGLLEDELDVYKAAKDRKKELDSQIKDRIEYIESIEQCESDIQDVKISLMTEKDIAQNFIKVLKRDLSVYKDYDVEKIESYEEVASEYQDEKIDIEKELETIKYANTKYSDVIKKFNAAKKQLEDNQGTFEVKSYWKKSLPQVKISMISEVIPFIENTTNNYLNYILPGKQIKFNVNPAKYHNRMGIDIIDTVHKIKRPIEGWSGGERERMNLACYLALNKLTSLRSGKEIDFIILDEKLVFIDVESRPIIFELIKSEYRDRKIWMISHLDDIKDEFDQYVEVTKVDGISTVEVKVA